MTQIAIVVHSRSRPNELKRMINNAVDNSYNPAALQFFIQLDSDDPNLLEYSQLDYETSAYREYFLSAPTSVPEVHEKLHAKAIKDPAVVAVILSYDYDVFDKDWDKQLHEIRRM